MLLVFCMMLMGGEDSAVFRWQAQKSGNNASIRGLSVIDDRTAWLGGSGGAWARTTDGGQTWHSGKLPGGDLDFRDVYAIDGRTALLLSIGEGNKSRLFKTEDGGQRWQLLYTNPWNKAFFNTIEFWDARNGIMVSDPIDDRPFLLRTSDGGRSWKRIPPDLLPPLVRDEYGFAASGSCIALAGKDHIWMATGGSRARVFASKDGGKSWTVHNTPISSGNPSSGIFSIAFRDKQHGVIVGGDYRHEDKAGNSVAWTRDGGKTWQLSGNHDSVAFRSCVAPMPGHDGTWIAVGPSGSSFSKDDGRSWQSFAGGFHVLHFGKTAGASWAAGRNGAIARLSVIKRN